MYVNYCGRSYFWNLSFVFATNFCAIYSTTLFLNYSSSKREKSLYKCTTKTNLCFEKYFKHILLLLRATWSERTSRCLKRSDNPIIINLSYRIKIKAWYQLRTNQAPCVSNTSVHLSIELPASVSAGFFRSQTRSRINLVSSRGGISFNTAVYFIALSYRASRSSIWVLWRDLLSVWWARAWTRKSVFTGANDISKADLLRLFKSSQVVQVRLLSSWFLPSRSPGSSRPSSCHFLPLSPSPFSFFSTTSAFYASPLHRSSPPFLSSPSLLRNVHQLFLSFHISSPFIFFVCKPGIPDRRECSRLCKGDRTHGPERRTGHEGRRDEREARKGRHPCIEGSHIGEFDATRIQLHEFIYSQRWLRGDH